MPVSDIGNITPIVREVALLKPKSVLDLGVGFGKYGVLCREVLDAVHGRCRPDQWQTRIDGVEGFSQYNNPCWKVYDNLRCEDFSKAFDTYKGYDLVLALDSLEHLDKTAGLTVLQALIENNRQVIVSVPIGNCPQGAEFGNEYERHRATWTGAEFNQYNRKLLAQQVCAVVSIKGKYGIS